MTSPAAVALRLAPERKPGCQQHRCQQANRCSHWTIHHLSWEQNATPTTKAHYFFDRDLYRIASVLLQAMEVKGRSWYPG